MSPLKKGLLVVGAPFTLAAMLGGAAAFASQSGGSSSDPAPMHSGSAFHRLAQGPNDGPADGSDCPHAGGGTTDGEAPVSPSVY